MTTKYSRVSIAQDLDGPPCSLAHLTMLLLSARLQSQVTLAGGSVAPLLFLIAILLLMPHCSEKPMSENGVCFSPWPLGKIDDRPHRNQITSNMGIALFSICCSQRENGLHGCHQPFRRTRSLKLTRQSNRFGVESFYHTKPAPSTHRVHPDRHVLSPSGKSVTLHERAYTHPRYQIAPTPTSILRANAATANFARGGCGACWWDCCTPTSPLKPHAAPPSSTVWDFRSVAESAFLLWPVDQSYLCLRLLIEDNHLPAKRSLSPHFHQD